MVSASAPPLRSMLYAVPLSASPLMSRTSALVLGTVQIYARLSLPPSFAFAMTIISLASVAALTVSFPAAVSVA